MLLKELLKYADIDYIAKAPPGKEVEQLTAKEITKALRNKVPAEEYLASLEKKERKLIEEARQAQSQSQQEIPQAQAIEVPVQEQAQQAEKIQIIPQPQPVQSAPPTAAPVTPQQSPPQSQQPSPELPPQLPPNVIDEMRKLGGEHWRPLYTMITGRRLRGYP